MYNTGLALGNLTKSAKEADVNNLLKIATYNGQIDESNAKGALAANEANQNAYTRTNMIRNEALYRALMLDEKLKEAKNATVNGNLTAFNNMLHTIGANENNYNLLSWAYQHGASAAKGGKLRTRRKRGLI
jgi:hypothetical protein